MNEPLSPFEAIAIAACGDASIPGPPQHIWEDLHDRGLIQTGSFDPTGEAVTYPTAAGEQALRENLVERAEHFLEKDEDGWSIKHSWDCGPDLLACPIHRAAIGQRGQHHQLAPGRYRIALVPPDLGEHGVAGLEAGKLEFTPVEEPS